MYDMIRYRKAKDKIKELEPIINDLDKICDIIYNNIGNSGMWKLLDVAEDIRIGYYLEHYNCECIVKSKGKTDYE